MSASFMHHNDARVEADRARWYPQIVKAITVRNLPPTVAREIRRRAKQDRASLNRTIIRLLEERLGTLTAEDPRKVSHHDLDFLCGTWTKQEADQFDASLRHQRVIDPELWK